MEWLFWTVIAVCAILFFFAARRAYKLNIQLKDHFRD